MKLQIKVRNTPVDVFFKSSWAHKNRAELKSTLTAFLLKNPDLFSSLSHTTVAGGFAAANRAVGFDMELANREISGRALKRVGTPEECAAAPSPISLWVMKEAAWKALKGPGQPSTISKIRITRIKKTILRGKSVFSFKFNKINILDIDGHGVLIRHGRLLMGIALVFS